MGSRTYETALGFEAQGLGWSYGDKPTFVLTRRELPRTRETVQFHAGDLAQFVKEAASARVPFIRFVGGGVVAADLRRGLDAATRRRRTPPPGRLLLRLFGEPMATSTVKFGFCFLIVTPPD